MAHSDQMAVLTQYVAGVDKLCKELSAGIAALASNDIDAFESHLQTQQALCRQLTILSNTPEFAPGGADDTNASALRAELRQHQQELARLNRQYASLLKRSEQTVSLLSLLFRSYNEGYGKTASGSSSGSLSCEV